MRARDPHGPARRTASLAAIALLLALIDAGRLVIAHIAATEPGPGRPFVTAGLTP